MICSITKLVNINYVPCPTPESFEKIEARAQGTLYVT